MQPCGRISLGGQPCRRSRHIPSIFSVAGFQELISGKNPAEVSYGHGIALHAGPDQLSHFDALLERMLQETRRKEANARHMVAALFQQFIVEICREFVQWPCSTPSVAAPVGKVLSHLGAAYAKPTSNKQLAGMAGLSLRTFLRRFRKATGFSPQQYLLRIRLARACHLLRETPAAITDIAFRTGFTDSNYFSRRFRDVIGLSPSDYRGKHT